MGILALRVINQPTAMPEASGRSPEGGPRGAFDERSIASQFEDDHAVPLGERRYLSFEIRHPKSKSCRLGFGRETASCCSFQSLKITPMSLRSSSETRRR